MTVKFEFELEDADAETLIDVLGDTVLRHRLTAQESGSEDYRAFWMRAAQHLENIKCIVLAGNHRKILLRG